MSKVAKITFKATVVVESTRVQDNTMYPLTMQSIQDLVNSQEVETELIGNYFSNEFEPTIIIKDKKIKEQS